MKEKGGAKNGISLGTKNWQEYFPFLWSNGGNVVDDAGKPVLNSPGGRRGPDVLQLVLQRGPDPQVRPRGLRYHAGLRYR